MSFLLPPTSTPDYIRIENNLCVLQPFFLFSPKRNIRVVLFDSFPPPPPAFGEGKKDTIKIIPS